jgi:hypothetical protein
MPARERGRHGAIVVGPIDDIIREFRDLRDVAAEGKCACACGRIVSVEMLSPSFNMIGSSRTSGGGVRSGSEAMFGPFTIFTLRASSRRSGGRSISVLMMMLSGSLTRGSASPNVPGLVITPFSADAAAVSGLTRHTLSSRVPDRPGKFRGTVRKLIVSVAGAWPVPMHP